MFDVKIIRFNAGPYANGALAFFDIALGDTDADGNFSGVFDVKGLVLKEKNDGTGYYYQVPSKPRLKGGKIQKDDEGRSIYDKIFDLHTQVVNGERKVPSVTWDFRERIIKDAVVMWEESQEPQDEGRGSDPVPATAAKAAADPFEGDEEEDDLPF
jgi:hypothetical protein